MSGQLTFIAMIFDSYNQICIFDEKRNNVYFNDITTRINNEFGNVYTRAILDSQKDTGRDFIQESEQLVYSVSKETGGCGSAKMDAWLDLIKQEYFKTIALFDKY